ncbi:hypothetical protein [Modestobacter sp. NPDC049651]|uniref:hypothetical protein n=1 Tax=unclassified Modestobacter TaxID=2643866 RepID=UPI0033E87374
MAYDALAESLALIEHGVTADPPRLSRRRRFAPLAVDVDGDVACTLFTRRGVAGFSRETHVLARDGGVWRSLGGGGVDGEDDDGLGDRPPAAELGGHLVVGGTGSVARSSGGLLPGRARYVHDAELRASREVVRVVVGARELDVPRHGQLVVVWSGRRPPAAVPVLADGRRLPGVPLELRSGPVAYRDN